MKGIKYIIKGENLIWEQTHTGEPNKEEVFCDNSPSFSLEEIIYTDTLNNEC